MALSMGPSFILTFILNIEILHTHRKENKHNSQTHLPQEKKTATVKHISFTFERNKIIKC